MCAHAEPGADVPVILFRRRLLVRARFQSQNPTTAHKQPPSAAPTAIPAMAPGLSEVLDPDSTAPGVPVLLATVLDEELCAVVDVEEVSDVLEVVVWDADVVPRELVLELPPRQLESVPFPIVTGSN